MKIVHVITRLVVGGAQENTLLNVEDLARMYGDDVTLVIGPDAGPEGTLLERPERGGFRLITVPTLHRELRPGDDWRCYRDLQKLFGELSPQIVHTHSSKAGILGRAAAAAVGIPCVHTVHGSPFHPWEKGWKNALYKRLERWAFSKSGHTISVCDAMTAQYTAAGIGTRENYTTIYSGMELEPFLHPSRSREEMRRELGIPDDAIVIGKVARLFELKGHDFLISIAPRLIKHHPRVQFLFVGDGILRTQMEETIARMGLANHFHFTGLVPPHTVPHYLQAMDIVVHASLREGLPRVLPQALLSKKPIVAFDLDGSPEVCRHEETGLLVEPESTDGLLAAIGRLIDNPAWGADLAQRGYELCLPMFDHEEMTRRVRGVYERILRYKTITAPAASNEDDNRSSHPKELSTRDPEFRIIAVEKVNSRVFRLSGMVTSGIIEVVHRIVINAETGNSEEQRTGRIVTIITYDTETDTLPEACTGAITVEMDRDDVSIVAGDILRPV